MQCARIVSPDVSTLTRIDACVCVRVCAGSVMWMDWSFAEWFLLLYFSKIQGPRNCLVLTSLKGEISSSLANTFTFDILTRSDGDAVIWMLNLLPAGRAGALSNSSPPMFSSWNSFYFITDVCHVYRRLFIAKAEIHVGWQCNRDRSSIRIWYDGEVSHQIVARGSKLSLDRTSPASKDIEQGGGVVAGPIPENSEPITFPQVGRRVASILQIYRWPPLESECIHCHSARHVRTSIHLREF